MDERVGAEFRREGREGEEGFVGWGEGGRVWVSGLDCFDGFMNNEWDGCIDMRRMIESAFGFDFMHCRSFT